MESELVSIQNANQVFIRPGSRNTKDKEIHRSNSILSFFSKKSKHLKNILELNDIKEIPVVQECTEVPLKVLQQNKEVLFVIKTKKILKESSTILDTLLNPVYILNDIFLKNKKFDIRNH